MINSINHNMKVDHGVCCPETDHIPSNQAHPVCMFTMCLQKQFKQINITIGPTMLLSICLCCVALQGAGVCEFDIFIFPLKNPAKRLQKERFNSMVYTALVALLLDKHPYLSLTTSSTTIWKTVVLAFPTLFNDLNTTKPELLLDLTTPAFSFISKDNSCLYPTLVEPTVERFWSSFSPF
ncbi:hypothetical protein EMCRGX_G003892 [Ephydatia muelleri]